MAAFENITQVGVRDCLRKNVIYFLVDKGKASMAIGREGQTIKTAEKMLGKQIKVYEYSDDAEELIKNLIPQAKKIEINGNKTATITLDSKDKGLVIGKDGNNIKIIKEILVRNSDVMDLRIF